MDVSFENRGDLPKRRGQCSAVSFCDDRASQWACSDDDEAVVVVWQHTGSAATRSQCSEAGGVCPICQGEFRDPRALLCQVNPQTCASSYATDAFIWVYSSRVKASWRDDFLSRSTYSVTSASLCGLTGRRVVLCAAPWSQRRSTNGETEPRPHTCRFTDWLWYWY